MSLALGACHTDCVDHKVGGWLCMSSQRDTVPDPLMKPEQPDLRKEFDAAYGKRCDKPPSKDENDEGGGNRSQDPPGDCLCDGSAVRLTEHQPRLEKTRFREFLAVSRRNAISRTRSGKSWVLRISSNFEA